MFWHGDVNYDGFNVTWFWMKCVVVSTWPKGL